VLNIGLGVVDYDSEKHMKQSKLKRQVRTANWACVSKFFSWSNVSVSGTCISLFPISVIPEQPGSSHLLVNQEQE